MCLWCNDKSKSFRSLSAVQRHMRDKRHCKMHYQGEAFLEYARFYDYTSSYPEGQNGDEEDEEEVSVDAIDDSGYELVLPSGARVGHRSLARYYKQSLNPDRRLAARPSQKVFSRYRALGWTGLTGAEAKSKARDVAFAQRAQRSHFVKQGLVGNYTLRHRFIDRNGFAQ